MFFDERQYSDDQRDRNQSQQDIGQLCLLSGEGDSVDFIFPWKDHRTVSDGDGREPRGQPDHRSAVSGWHVRVRDGHLFLLNGVVVSPVYVMIPPSVSLASELLKQFTN